MSMSIQTGDDIDEVDDDLERDDDDDRDDEPRGKGKPKGRQADDEDDDQDDDEDDNRSPEDLKAEVKRLRASLSKANSSGNRRRQQLKELRAANAALSDKDEDDEDDDEGDDGEKPKQKPANRGLDAKAAQRLVNKAVNRRERELAEEHKRDLVDTRAESALVKAGVSEKNIRLLKRELDYDELDLDPKTRSVDGLEDEIDRLRSEFPDLFKSAKAARRRINGGDEREAGGRRKKPMTATERQVALLEGRG